MVISLSLDRAPDCTGAFPLQAIPHRLLVTNEDNLQPLYGSIISALVLAEAYTHGRVLQWYIHQGHRGSLIPKLHFETWALNFIICMISACFAPSQDLRLVGCPSELPDCLLLPCSLPLLASDQSGRWERHPPSPRHLLAGLPARCRSSAASENCQPCSLDHRED